MSQVLKCSTKGKSAPEVQVLLQFPVLDSDCCPRATQGSMLDSTAQTSVLEQFPAKKHTKETSGNTKFRGGNQNIKPRVRDHVWSRDTCAKNGCKECCGCVAQQFQCDRCAEDNIFVLSKKIHEASLQDWHRIDHSEGVGYIEEDIEVVTHDMAANNLHQGPLTNIEQETFEIVDGCVETELVDGRLVKVWKDIMLLEDCGHESQPKPLSSWHGLA